MSWQRLFANIFEYTDIFGQPFGASLFDSEMMDVLPIGRFIEQRPQEELEVSDEQLQLTSINLLSATELPPFGDTFAHSEVLSDEYEHQVDGIKLTLLAQDLFFTDPGRGPIYMFFDLPEVTEEPEYPTYAGTPIENFIDSDVFFYEAGRGAFNDWYDYEVELLLEPELDAFRLVSLFEDLPVGSRDYARVLLSEDNSYTIEDSSNMTLLATQASAIQFVVGSI